MRSKTKLNVAIAAVFAATCLLGNLAFAGSEKRIINATAITYYPPFESKDPVTNKLIGFDIDLVEALASRMGMKVEWKEASFAQLVNSIQTKRADIIVGITDVKERRANVSFVDYLRDDSVFYTMKTNASHFPDIDALCGRRVAVTRSATFWNTEVARTNNERCISKGKPAMLVIGTDSSADAQLQLTQGRVDAAVQSTNVLSYQNSIAQNRFQTVGQPFTAVIEAIGFSKDDPQLGLALKKALSEMMADGTFQKLLTKWNMVDGSTTHRVTINGEA